MTTRFEDAGRIRTEAGFQLQHVWKPLVMHAWRVSSFSEIHAVVDDEAAGLLGLGWDSEEG